MTESEGLSDVFSGICLQDVIGCTARIPTVRACQAKPRSRKWRFGWVMPVEVTLIQVHGICLSVCLSIYLSSYIYLYLYLSIYRYTCNRLSGWLFSTFGSLDAVFVTCFSINFEGVSCKYTSCFALAGSPRPWDLLFWWCQSFLPLLAGALGMSILVPHPLPQPS